MFSLRRRIMSIRSYLNLVPKRYLRRVLPCGLYKVIISHRPQNRTRFAHILRRSLPPLPARSPSLSRDTPTAPGSEPPGDGPSVAERGQGRRGEGRWATFALEVEQHFDTHTRGVIIGCYSYTTECSISLGTRTDPGSGPAGGPSIAARGGGGHFALEAEKHNCLKRNRV